MHAGRGQPGQIYVAGLYRDLLAGSAIRESHRYEDTRVQDPYSLRCQPQVMGASFDLLSQAATTLLIEANAVSDNPLVFADKIGRASCRERVCKYVYISVVAVSLQKKTTNIKLTTY